MTQNIIPQKLMQFFLIEDYMVEEPNTRNVDNGWRHGCNVREVYKLDRDLVEKYPPDEDVFSIESVNPMWYDQYYSVWYRVSTDGEYNGIRENDFVYSLVKPIKKIVEITEWVKDNGESRINISDSTNISAN